MTNIEWVSPNEVLLKEVNLALANLRFTRSFNDPRDVADGFASVFKNLTNIKDELERQEDQIISRREEWVRSHAQV